MSADTKSFTQPSRTVLGAFTFLWEMEAIFGDVLCSLLNALLHAIAGAEIKDLSLRVLQYMYKDLGGDWVWVLKWLVGRWEGCVSVRSLVGGIMVVVLRSYEAFRFGEC